MAYRRYFPFFLADSLTVIFGLLFTVDCLTKRPEIALRPRFPLAATVPVTSFLVKVDAATRTE